LLDFGGDNASGVKGYGGGGSRSGEQGSKNKRGDSKFCEEGGHQRNVWASLEPKHVGEGHEFGVKVSRVIKREKQTGEAFSRVGQKGSLMFNSLREKNAWGTTAGGPRRQPMGGVEKKKGELLSSSLGSKTFLYRAG